jgi:peptidoglycan/xylan/chitin deacetylase (PgdA/CDA1 family)
MSSAIVTSSKKFFTRTKIEFIVAFIGISFIAVHGYASFENMIYSEQSEAETSINKTKTDIVRTATTTIPILLYHKIDTPESLLLPNDYRPRRRYSVQVNVFEEQMKFVQEQGYTPLTMKELIADEQNNTLPEKPIAITFDDGWKSQYDNALPILVKYHMPATFYIYTGVTGSPLYMSLDDLHSLINLGMEIGDHSRSHPRLTRIDPSRLNGELVQSKHFLEKNLQIPVSDFAYPYGDYNNAIIEAVKNAGYTSARTSNKNIHNDFKDLFQLNTLYVPDDLEALKSMLSQ